MSSGPSTTTSSDTRDRNNAWLEGTVTAVSIYVDAKNGAILAYAENTGLSTGAIQTVGRVSSGAFIGLDVALGYYAEGTYGAVKGAIGSAVGYEVGSFFGGAIAGTVVGGPVGAILGAIGGGLLVFGASLATKGLIDQLYDPNVPAPPEISPNRYK